MRSFALLLLVGMVVSVCGREVLAAQAPTQILPADGVDNDRFGSSVATLGNMLIIGSPRTPSSPSPAPGAAYVIENGNTCDNREKEVEIGSPQKCA